MKDKRLYYECVMNCQVGYMGLDQRRERWIDNQPGMCLHERTFLPENPFDKSKPAMILAVDRPLADRYTAEITKIIRRKNLRTGEWEDKPTHTKIKFVQLEPEDITSDIRSRAVYMSLRDCDYAEMQK
jgi:hypothetical protein